MLDIPHYNLLKCQINQTLLSQSTFRVTNSDSSMYCAAVVNFKLKVQVVNDLLGNNFFIRILII